VKNRIFLDICNICDIIPNSETPQAQISIGDFRFTAEGHYLVIDKSKYKIEISGTSDKALSDVSLSFRNAAWDGNYSGNVAIDNVDKLEIVYKGTDSFVQDVTFATLTNVTITLTPIDD
jgi:hypothetical protein